MDRDVVATSYTFNFTQGAVVFTDLSSADTPHVRVAYSDSSYEPRFCIVYQRRVGSGIGGLTLWSSEVRYHMRDAGALAYSASSATISRPNGAHDWRPDVGGMLQTSTTDPLFLIVFQREQSGSWLTNTPDSRVRGRLILDASTAVAASFSTVTPSATDQEVPALNQSTKDLYGNTTVGCWLVVWQERNSSLATDPWRVVGRVLCSDLSQAYAPWVCSGAAAGTHHRMGPQVAGRRPSEFVVGFSRTPVSTSPNAPAIPSGTAICSERVTYSPGAVLEQHPETVLASATTPSLQVGSVSEDYDDSFWAMTWYSTASNGGAAAMRLGYNGAAVETVSLPGTATGTAEAVGLWLDETTKDWLVGWSVVGSPSGNAGYVAFLAQPIAPPPQVSGVGCSNATVGWFGSQRIGSGFQQLALQGAPPSVPAFASLSMAPLNVDLSFLQMPGCWLLVDILSPNYIGLLASVTSPFGSKIQGIALPEFLTPFTLYAQYGIFDVGANPANLVTTQRLEVPFVK
jgi:hypothetical protein